MMNNRRSNLESSRKSVSYWVGQFRSHRSLKNIPDYYSLSDTHAIIQDVSIGVLPVPGYSKRKYEVILQPSDDKTAKLIAKALKDERYARGLTNPAYDFFKSCSGTMMAYGKSFYEIVYSLTEKKVPVEFRLIPIHPSTVFSRRGRIWQYVPAQVAREQNLPSQQIELPSENVLVFHLPSSAQRNHRRMMESLAFLSVNFMPEFTMTNMKGETQIPFDLSTFSHGRKIALATATKDIGWSGRQLFRNEILEYYFFYRHLMFERFKCEMRNVILDTLNVGIDRAGSLLGFKGRLKIVGLPTIDEIRHSLDRLQASDKSFDEVMKPYIYS